MALEVKNIDLFSDWANLVRQNLSSQLFNVNGINNDEISILHYTLKKRLIFNKPRKIHKSNVFTCPRNLQDGLELLENKIENGENLRPHQSRLLQDLENKDGLLFDWDIHHFHLGTVIESDGFIKRTGPLLYALIDENNVYFIDILNHGQWTNQNLLNIIHQNWPDTIDNFRIKDSNVVGLEHNAADEEINALRRANINVLIEVQPGVIYIGPGGGLVASGHSGAAVNSHLDNLTNLKDLENSIKADPEAFLQPIFPDINSFVNTELDFEMKNNGAKYYLHEKNNNFEVILNQ